MNFDLNIDHYKKNELEEIFELPSDYNEDLIESREKKLRNNIISNKTIQNDLKPEILNFLTEAKKIIREGFSKNDIGFQKIAALNKTYDNIYHIGRTLKKSPIISDGGTFIIDKPKTPFGQSRPSEFYEGVINPLDTRILRKNLNIDSRFRDNYYTTVSSNFHIDLPVRFNQIVSMQLTSLEFPSTFYTISKVFGNNFFCIVLHDIKEIIVVPDGNYTVETMQAFLNNLMQSYASSETLSLLQYISFTIDLINKSGSGKMIVGISSTYEDPINFSLDFATDLHGQEDRNTPLPLKLGWLFGFRAGSYVNNSVYVSEGMVDLQGPRYLYLVIDDFNNNISDGFYAAFNSSILNKNILARISLQGNNLFNNVVQNNLSLVTYARQYFGPVVIQKLQVQLLDEYGRILDLNNMDYSFCLYMQAIYDL